MTEALASLKPVWNHRSISLSSKIGLMRSFVTSSFLCAGESWPLTADLQTRLQVMEMRCYREILLISYKDNVTNEEVRAKIQQTFGPNEDHLTIIKRRKLQWYRHIYRPGVCKVPEGSGEHRKLEEAGCEVICGAPTILAVKG